MLQTAKAWALGRERLVTYDDATPLLVKASSLAFKTMPLGATPKLIAGWDTSQTLNSANVAALWNLGTYGWGARYVNLYGQSPAVGIQTPELDAIITTGFGLILVQFARTGTQTQAMARSDGQAAAERALSLGLPNTMCLAYDCAVFSSATDAINCSNAWYGGAVSAGWNGSFTRVYYEPGVPLTAEQRYQDVAFPGYWITAAGDPNRWPSTRGGQIIQLWPGDRVVTPGVVVDNDAAQEDYLGSYATAAFAA